MPNVEKLNRIMVVVDAGMRQTAALRRGVELAKRSGAQLFMLLFDYDVLIDRAGDLLDPRVMELARRSFIDERLGWLSAQAAGWADQGVAVECDVVWAPVVHEAIIAKVLEFDIDLVVKDVQEETRVKRLLFRPSDWRLLRLCPVPLMLVHPQSMQLPRRIAASVDTGVESAKLDVLNERILRVALLIGLYADAEVKLVHVLPFSSERNTLATQRLDYIAIGVQTEDRERFEAFTERHKVPPERVGLLNGDTVGSLMQFAGRNGIELLVLGSAYRSSFDRFLLGSTAEDLLTQANCDVLLVKPANFLEQLVRHMDVKGALRRYSAPRPEDGLSSPVPVPAAS